MTWGLVLLFAVATAVVTAVLNEIHALDGTSFQDIAISFECWILFAVFVVVNCEKWWEAALKCFVFFLISQPLIYLIEVPFEPLGWDVFMYYDYWAKVTLLTLPGGAIAFLVKKKNWLSVIVLSVATCFLAYLSTYYLQSLLNNFPYHLLSAVFCLALAFFLVLVLLDEKKHRAAGIAVFMAVFLICTGFTIARSGIVHRNITLKLDLGDGEWTYVDESADMIDSVVVNGENATVHFDKSGACLMTFRNESGQEQTYNIVVDGKKVLASPVD